ncbi:MAG: LysM peptidoglycan-binding domain-containing protein [Gaiellaceae bacterium]
MDPERSRELKRYGVPAAFLLAVTIAVLLVKSGLDDSEPATTAAAPTTTARTTTQQTTTKLVLTTTPATTSVADAQYYVIETGDTLGGIASSYDTTVEELLSLNPDLDPNALQPGTRIRVS